MEVDALLCFGKKKLDELRMRFNIGKFVGLASQPERASLNGRMFRAQEREEALPWMLKYFSDILRTLGRGCSHKRLDGCSQKLALTWGHL